MERYKNNKKLKQAFKGMSERFKNPRNNITEICSFMVKAIYAAYELNDFEINNAVITSKKHVIEVLEKKLITTDTCSDEYFEIQRAIFVIEAVMVPFYKQALKDWE